MDSGAAAMRVVSDDNEHVRKNGVERWLGIFKSSEIVFEGVMHWSK